MAGPPKKPPIKFNGAYCCSHNLLIFKLLEMVLTLVSLVMAIQYEGDGMIIFIATVMALAFVSSAAWVLLYCINLNARFPEFFPILMMIYHLVMAALCLGATICGAFLWPQFILPFYAVATICSCIAGILYVIETVICMLWWRGAVDEIITCPCSPWEADLNI